MVKQQSTVRSTNQLLQDNKMWIIVIDGDLQTSFHCFAVAAAALERSY